MNLALKVYPKGYGNNRRLRMSNKLNTIPIKQRALVLQGGGSLGAYEAGAYMGIYEFLSNWDKDHWKEKRSTFDIIAGTSIGAINSAVLVS
ncbi:MAG: patatin-like phospholipase family protein [Candidatus Nitrosocosmicus sp.]|nr:patatin-like phospholipase family protein [Candidatus Nitrosocosmicus sp.]MDN5867393.1 patatin-like phospholipase family protein [Candidatus Nitrosocosmicus sp.]